eukprot:TRINITY_DN42441_c0_g1_i1.p1 TRINITY_DN42441_c0_g1~~TRINITY_DN42441_c0_g1_i1.p1  ORF type:complete len:517 (-),score=26.19 TRINITY_DN42441_c0_g1_i1:208-1758(-)
MALYIQSTLAGSATARCVTASPVSRPDASLSSSFLAPSRSLQRAAQAARSARKVAHRQCGVRAMAVRRRKAGVEDPMMDEAGRGQDKMQRVRDAVEEINKKYGANTASFLGDTYKRAFAETFPSGSLNLDIALGGGLPRGRIVEIYGQESSGKTTLALHAIAEMQRQGGKCWLVDAEHALDMAYAQKLGVNLEELVLCQSEEAETALEIVDTVIRGKAADLVVIDSVPALIPAQELENEIGAESIGLLARLMSKTLRKLSNSAGRAGCTIIFLNQLRHKINVGYGNPETTTGGMALKYYSSVRLEMRMAGRIKSAGEEDVGIRVRVKVAKSKVCTPYRTAEFDIIFGKGISYAGCVLDCAESFGLVERRGSWYSYDQVMRVQGRDNAVNFLIDNKDVCDQLDKLVCTPYRTAEFDIIFGKGISYAGCVLDCAESFGLVERRGSWYSYDQVMRVQGRDNAVNFLIDNKDVCDQLDKLVRELIPNTRLLGEGASSDGKALGIGVSDEEEAIVDEDLDF